MGEIFWMINKCILIVVVRCKHPRHWSNNYVSGFKNLSFEIHDSPIIVINALFPLVALFTVADSLSSWTKLTMKIVNLEEKADEWFSSNRILMFCAQDFGIARGQTLRVAIKNCMAWSCFSVKRGVSGHRMPHFAMILWEMEVTNVGALKFQVSVWLMR